MSLAGLIKKNIYARPHEAVVFYPTGFQRECASELEEIFRSLTSTAQFVPALHVGEKSLRMTNIHYRSLLETALRCRTARDILWVVGGTRAASVKEIRAGLQKVRWPLLLDESAVVAVKGSIRDSRFRHEGVFESCIASELSSNGFSVADRKGATDLVDARLENNRLETALSLSGSFLHYRRYRPNLAGGASIKEDLAACLVRSTFDWLSARYGTKYVPEQILCPFAGSGTLGFEAFFAQTSVPASLFRGDLAILRMKPSRSPALKYIENELYKRCRAAPPCPTTFVESSDESCQALEDTTQIIAEKLKSHLVPARFEIIAEDVFDLHRPFSPNTDLFVPLNPPYGSRLKLRTPPARLYRRIGEKLEDWNSLESGSRISGFLLAPDRESERAFCKAAASYSVEASDCIHGGKKIRFIRFATL